MFKILGGKRKNSTVVKLSPNLQKMSSGFIKNQQYSHFSELERATVFIVLWFLREAQDVIFWRNAAFCRSLGSSWMHIEWSEYFYMQKNNNNNKDHYISVFSGWILEEFLCKFTFPFEIWTRYYLV